MSVLRQHRKVNFTTIPNDLINDESLSSECRMMLIYLLSKPTDWKVVRLDIQRKLGWGKDKTYRVFREAMEAGYLRRIQTRGGDGTIEGYDYEVTDSANCFSDQPLSDSQRTDNKALTKDLDNQTLNKQTPSGPPQGDGSLFDESGDGPAPESKPHHPPPSPHKRAEEVRQLWAEMMPASIPTPKIITDTRARAVAAREKDLKKLGIAWYQFFQMITASNFLMGGESSPNSLPFKATFDWVMKPTNFAKIIDGNYKNRPRPANYGGSYVNPESGTGGVL